jgi:8-oxo-dGTP diphosphatase
MTVFLVRHADAKSRANWPHPDESRPLTKRGVVQAEGLVDLLHRHPIERVLSSPSVRCVDTVAPLAHKVGQKIEETDLLQEGSDPATTYDLLRAVARGPGDTVLCTHGDLIPELLRIATRDGLALDDAPRWPKGSTWMIEADGKRFKRGRYLPPPEA